MKKLLCIVVVVALFLLAGCNSRGNTDDAYERGYEAAREEMQKELEREYKRGYEDGQAALYHDYAIIEFECPDCEALFYIDPFERTIEGRG